jgi:histidinol-phosphate/aromatic aminotransferase/cobyric acid decarboxylase-like protein
VVGGPVSRPSIPAAGPHGGDGPAVARALGLAPRDVLDLSQSLNPLAPDPVPAVARHLDALRTYPDTTEAAAALARAMGVAADRLLLTNGGAEAIALLAAETGGRVDEPEFSLHPRGGGPRWRSNPHSPSGLLARADETADVWDEAFFPLATGHWTRGDGVPVVGSLTKLLACPGLRAGYLLADPGLVERCRVRQPAWSVGGLVASALPELLAAVDLPAWRDGVARLRRSLVGVLAAHGLAAGPSDANWVLVEAPGLREALAPHAVVVRDCTSFGLAGVARIAVPDETGLTRLDEALRASGVRRTTLRHTVAAKGAT